MASSVPWMRMANTGKQMSQREDQGRLLTEIQTVDPSVLSQSCPAVTLLRLRESWPRLSLTGCLSLALSLCL